MCITESPQGVLTNSLSRGGAVLLGETVASFGYKDSSPETRLNYGNARKLAENRRNAEEPEKKIAVSPYSPWYLDASVFQEWLAAFSPGYGISVHIPQTPALDSVINQLGYRHILIMRDPRALFATIVFGGDMPLYFLNADFERLSPSEQLRFLAEGGYAVKADAQVKNFAEVYRSMLAWQEDSDCLIVRYEDLIGDSGRQKQREAILNIAASLNINAVSSVNEIVEELNGPETSWADHLRMDHIDEWKQTIAPHDWEYIMEYCQPLCREAGY